MSRREPGGCLVALLVLGPGCRGEVAPAGQPAPPAMVEAEVEDEFPRFEAIDPASVEPLEVVFLPRDDGPGYPRVGVDIGPPLASAKRLGFSRDSAEFFGPRHVLVETFSGAEVSSTLLVDVEAGTTRAEFLRVGRVVYAFGLAIVYQAGDERPYLLDAATGSLVLAVPAGEHGYALGENYWLRLSPVGPHVWVYARDEAGTHHLYAWTELGSPPELPNNPFPFEPEAWDPLPSSQRSDADSEEVTQSTGDDAECTRALLQPPKGWRCLDELGVEGSRPIGEGWRLDETRTKVFSLEDGEGYDLSPLCGEDALLTQIRYRSPPQLEVQCYDEDGSWMLWTAPKTIRRLAPEYAKRLHKGLIETWHEDIGRYVLTEFEGPTIVTASDPSSGLNRTVGEDYQCPSFGYRTGTRTLSGVFCEKEGSREGWAELRSDLRRQRTHRFDAVELAVSAHELAVAIVHRGGREELVRVRMKMK